MRSISFFIAVVSVVLTACSSIAEEKKTVDIPLPQAGDNFLPWLSKNVEKESDNKEEFEVISGKKKAEVIKQVNTYLNGLTTMVSPFVQLASNGQLSDGMFYLLRPGYLRWEYTQPTPIVIVANKGKIAYVDKELEQISHISVDETPLAFLLDKVIDLNKDGIEVTDVKEYDAVLDVTIEQKTGDYQGSLILTFNANPTELKKVSVLDVAGNKTVITFTNAVYHQTIDRSLFIVEDPRLYRDKRN